MTTLKLCIIGFVFFTISCQPEQKQNVTNANKPKYQLDWVIAHAPVKYFEKTASLLNKRLLEETNGEVGINVIIPDIDNGQRNITEDASYNQVTNGDYDMVQVYTSAFMMPEFNTLSLPYLFENHEHVDRVVEGKTGRELFNKLQERNSKIEGLAFTYSGGYMVVISRDKPLRKPSDFEGIRYRTWIRPVTNEAIAKRLKTNLHISGQNFLDRTFGLKEAFALDFVDAGVQTYADAEYIFAQEYPAGMKPKYLNEIYHRLFTTAIVINKDSLNKIPVKYHDTLRHLTKDVAKMERRFLVEDVARIRKKLQKQGIEIVSLSENEISEFKKVLAPVYNDTKDMVDLDLAKRIKAEILSDKISAK